MIMQFYDYKSVDYVMVYFRYNTIKDNIYALGGNTNNAITNATVNGVSCTITNYNLSSIKISLNPSVALPTSLSPSFKIVISNVNNPVIVGNSAAYV